MPTTITAIHTVGVPVVDQDRALAFYTDTLGFDTRVDAAISEDMRWIEVAPSGAVVSVALVAASEQTPAGIDTGIRFVTADVEAEHRSMTASGVDVDEILRWPDVPAMFTFRDPDGNTLYVVESFGG